MIGTEPRPSQIIKSEPSLKQDPTRLLTLNSRLAEATVTLRTAQAALTSATHDEALQSHVTQAQEEFDNVLSELLSESDKKPPTATVDPTKTSDWDRRHDLAYRCLQISLSPSLNRH